MLNKFTKAFLSLSSTFLLLTSCTTSPESKKEKVKVQPKVEQTKTKQAVKDKTLSPGKFVQLKKFAHRGKEKPQYIIKTDSSIELEVTFVRADVVRIQAGVNGNYKDPLNDLEKAQILVDHNIRANAPSIKETATTITFSNDKLILVYTKSNSTFELKSADGKQLWKELKPLAIGPIETTQTLTSNLKEYYYGGGQQNGYFSHKGTKIDIKADGNWNEGGHPNPAPFYMSNNGYGVLRNTFSIGVYDFTNNEAIQTIHRERRFDAYYFVGKSFNRILDLYTQFTGRPNFVPIWGLELGEADAYMTRDKKTKELVLKEDGTPVEHTPDVIDRLAEKYREHDMPAGWILPNDGYGCGYEDLPYVVKQLHQLGFYTGLWTEGELIRTKWEVGTAGTRVQKLDVAWTGAAYQHALDCNSQAWNSIVENSNSRGMVWTVQGWAGTQRYGICWTGDQYGSWDLIRYHIPTLTGSGLSGQAYATTDVDGIFGGSPETYTRDLQWKCFTPVLYVMNGWAGKINKSPWWYDEPYRSINRKYLKLKMRMTPYMYKYTKEAYDTGAPITRPMVWNYPHDEHTFGKETQYQYMLGDSLLIAPVYTSMRMNKGWRKEDIYLPKGQWIDYADGRKINGPHIIDNYPITLEKLPIFVKAGAIIPLYPEMLYNNQKPKDPLTFDIYPYGKSEFQMYEDDGLTRLYQQGDFTTQLIQVDAPKGVAGNISINVNPSIGDFNGKLESRVYQFEVHSELKPTQVTYQGEKLLELTHPKAYKNIVQGWYFDPNDRRGIVHIKLPRQLTKHAAKLTLVIDKNQKIPASPAYPIPVQTRDLDKSLFTTSCNSELRGFGIDKAFDGMDNNMWHTLWDNTTDKHPYLIKVELGGVFAVNELKYVPRQEGDKGRIKDYAIYAGMSLQHMKRVAKGTFKNSKETQSVKFPTTWAKFVRIEALSEVNGHDYATAAEFDILQDLTAKPLPDTIQYLSDLKPDSFKGEFKNDLSIKGNKLKVNDTEYAKGLGAKSGSEITYLIDGSWDRLSGHVGMDDEVGDGGTVMFRVYVDGNLLFESPKQTGKSIKQLMNLDIRGAKKLRLVLLDGGDGSKDDHGDWIDAKLIRKGSE